MRKPTLPSKLNADLHMLAAVRHAANEIAGSKRTMLPMTTPRVALVSAPAVVACGCGGAANARAEGLLNALPATWRSRWASMGVKNEVN